MLLLALLSVVCAFSAVTAQPHGVQVQSTGIFHVWDNYKEMQHAAFVQGRVTSWVYQATHEVEDLFRRNDRWATDFIGDFNVVISDLAAKAAHTGADVAECTALQQQLPQVADKLRAEVHQCIEHELQHVNGSIQALKSVAPKLAAILDEVQKDGVECKAQGGSLKGWWCAGMAWDKYKERADTAIDEADPLILSVRHNFGKIHDADNCYSATSPTTVAQATSIGSSTITCLQSKLNKV